MNRNYQTRIDTLNMLLRFMIIFTIVGLLTLLITDSAMYLWKTPILFQASIISFLINRLTKHIWSYIFWHLALLACYLLLTDDIILRVLYAIFIISFAMVQFFLELKDKLTNTPLAFLVVFFFMYFFCRYNYSEEKLLTGFFFYFTMVYGLIYVVNRHLINYTSYLQKHKEKANIPLKQINFSNNIYITGFLMLCCITMMVFTKIFPIGSILRYVGIFLRNLLRIAFSGLVNAPAGVEIEEVIPPEEVEVMEDEFKYQIIDPPEFLLKALKVLLALSFGLFVVLLISLIIYGLYRIYKLYYQTKGFANSDEEIEVLSPFESINLGLLSGRRMMKKGLLSYIGRSNNEKIRKQYQKAIQKNTKPDKALRYYTPSELSQYAVANNALNMNKEAKSANDMKVENSADTEKKAKIVKEKELTELYEKARYSNIECSKDDVQSVKNILK